MMSITWGLVLPPKPMVTTAKVLVAPSPVLAAVSWPMSVLISQKDTCDFNDNNNDNDYENDNDKENGSSLMTRLSLDKPDRHLVRRHQDTWFWDNDMLMMKMTAVTKSVLISHKENWEAVKGFWEVDIPRNSWRWWWGECRSGGCRSQGCGRTWTWGRWWSGCRSSSSPPSSPPSSSWPGQSQHFSICLVSRCMIGKN